MVLSDGGCVGTVVSGIVALLCVTVQPCCLLRLTSQLITQCAFPY